MAKSVGKRTSIVAPFSFSEVTHISNSCACWVIYIGHIADDRMLPRLEDCPGITGNRVISQSSRLWPPLRGMPQVFKDTEALGAEFFCFCFAEKCQVASWRFGDRWFSFGFEPRVLVEWENPNHRAPSQEES